jgi:hypothetical protein
VLTVSEGLAQLAHALSNWLLVYDHTRPQSAEELLSMNKSACVQKQKAKDVEGLGSKLDVAVRCLERTTFGIKGKP